MLKLSTGSPVQNPVAVAAMSKRASVENPIAYAAGASRTGEVTKREFPILGLLCRLSVTIAGADGNEVASPFGLWNLIERIKVAVDGSDTRYFASGKTLQYLDWMATGHKPFSDFDPTADGTYEAYFYIPFDLGGYRTPLYAADNSSLDIQIDWADQDAAYTGGTATIDSAQLRTQVNYVVGGEPGKFGGKGNHYRKQYLLSQTVDVNSTRPDLRIESLFNSRGYHGLTVFAYDENGAASDTVVNNLRLLRADAEHMRIDRQNIRADNVQRYKVADPADFVGVLDLPFVDPGHGEHVLSIRNDQSMLLIGDVSKPAGGDGKIELVTQFVLN